LLLQHNLSIELKFLLCINGFLFISAAHSTPIALSNTGYNNENDISLPQKQSEETPTKPGPKTMKSKSSPMPRKKMIAVVVGTIVPTVVVAAIILMVVFLRTDLVIIQSANTKQDWMDAMVIAFNNQSKYINVNNDLKFFLKTFRFTFLGWRYYASESGTYWFYF